jgi:dTDP-4-dehydrorhamnose reductase
MTRWLVTGATGMLGSDLSSEIAAAGEPVVPLSRKDLDITDAAAITAAVEAAKPDVVVNCAAWTAVDDAQEHEEEALAVNGHAVASLAAACASAGAVLVQVSTDYVFDGLATSPSPEDGATAPRTAYGRTKLAGERALLATLPDSAYVVRTAWLYGAHGPNFVATMIRLAAAGTSPAVIDDQRGQPTWSLDVARQIRALIGVAAPPGIYHATSSGETTWYGLASEVFSLCATAHAGSATGTSADSGRPAPVPTTSARYRRPAPRPGYSVLGHAAWAAAGIPPIGHWRDSLHRAFPAMLAASQDRPGPTQRGTSSLVASNS